MRRITLKTSSKTIITVKQIRKEFSEIQYSPCKNWTLLRFLSSKKYENPYSIHLLDASTGIPQEKWLSPNNYYSRRVYKCHNQQHSSSKCTVAKGDYKSHIGCQKPIEKIIPSTPGPHICFWTLVKRDILEFKETPFSFIRTPPLSELFFRHKTRYWNSLPSVIKTAK